MLLIRKARVLVRNLLVKRDILIEEGRIKAVGRCSEFKGEAGSGETINAEGLVALPGMIDAHVHFREPGLTHKEDWASGSRAAAKGGITSVIDMPNTAPQTTTLRALEQKRELAKKSIVNYGIYFGATNSNIEEAKKAENIAGVKLYAGSSTGNMLVESEQAISAYLNSGLYIAVHAEDEKIIREREEKFRGSAEPSIHSKIRPKEAALAAVERLLRLRKGKKSHLHFAHASTPEEVRVIRAGGASGKVSVEVCPHHLFLDVRDYKRLGNFAKVNPPLRTREDRAGLWELLRKGMVDTIATDHAPHTREEKEREYWSAPAGMPGVENALPLMLNAVNSRMLSLSALVSMFSENPARLLGIRGKGFIREGMDADIVLVDMKEEKTIRNQDQETRCGWTPYDGMRAKGWPVTTIVMGKPVFSHGEFFKSTGARELMFMKRA